MVAVVIGIGVCQVISVWGILLVLAINARSMLYSRLITLGYRVAAFEHKPPVPAYLLEAVEYTQSELHRVQRTCTFLTFGWCKPLIAKDGERI